MVNRMLQAGKRVLAQQTHKIYELPILILMPHSRCNCRCVMCDIWKANQNGRELTLEDFAPHLDSMRKLQVQQVVFSGGEALMHSNLWRFCEALKGLNIKITLLSTGLLLKPRAERIIQWCDEVIVSLDGSEAVHDRIRDTPRAYRKLAEGVATVKALREDFPITGRCVLQRLNYQDFPHIIDAAKSVGLDQISFLAADVSTSAFNRPEGLTGERAADIAPGAEEVKAFQEIVEQTVRSHASDFRRKFVAESPDKIRSLVQYYAALNGQAEFPRVRCNAPWVSAVVETNGDVLPCFFHQKLGNIHDQDLQQILNARESVAFRRKLDVKTNPVCRKCVCSLYLNPGAKVS